MPRGKEATRPLGDNGNNHPCSWNRFLSGVNLFIARSNQPSQAATNCGFFLLSILVFHTLAIILIAEESYVDQEKLRCTCSMSLIVECVWFLVGRLARVGFSLMNNFFTKRETKTLCRESRVYYGSWKLNKTMCDWCVVRSGACFGQRWKPVCDTAPLFGLDWYPASVAATEIFSTLIRLFTPNSVAAAFQLEPIAEKLVFSICICRNQNANQLSWPIN